MVNIKFSNPEEAFMGAAIAIACASNKQSTKQLSKLDELTERLNVFKNYTYIQFTEAFTKFRMRFLKLFNKSIIKPSSLDVEELETVVKGIKETLSPELQEHVYLMVVELAYADGLILNKNENMVLTYFQRNLEIKPETIQEIHENVTLAPLFMLATMMVIFANGEATRTEFDELENLLTQLDSFKDYNISAFTNLRMKVLYPYGKSPLPNKVVPFNDNEIDDLINSAKNILTPELRRTFFRISVQVACLDGLDELERTVLDKFRHGLEIDLSLSADMIINITIPQAFMSIALAVIAADEEVSLEEYLELKDVLKEILVFKDYADEDLYALQKQVLSPFDKNLFLGETTAFTSEEVERLINNAKAVLGPDLRADAFRMAVKIACFDKLNESEDKLLNNLQAELEIPQSIVDKAYQDARDF